MFKLTKFYTLIMCSFLYTNYNSSWGGKDIPTTETFFMEERSIEREIKSKYKKKKSDH